MIFFATLLAAAHVTMLMGSVCVLVVLLIKAAVEDLMRHYRNKRGNRP